MKINLDLAISQAIEDALKKKDHGRQLSAVAKSLRAGLNKVKSKRSGLNNDSTFYVDAPGEREHKYICASLEEAEVLAGPDDEIFELNPAKYGDYYSHKIERPK